MMTEEQINKNAKEFIKNASWGKSSFTTIQVTRLLKLFAKEQVKSLQSEKAELVEVLENAKKAMQQDIDRRERDLKRLSKEHSLLGNKHDLTGTQRDRKAFLSNYCIELFKDIDKSKKIRDKIFNTTTN